MSPLASIMTVNEINKLSSSSVDVILMVHCTWVCVWIACPVVFAGLCAAPAEDLSSVLPQMDHSCL